MRRPDGRWTVYGLVDPSDCRIYYVGLTGDLVKRLSTHRRMGAGGWDQSGVEMKAWFHSLAARRMMPGLIVLGLATERAEALALEALVTKTGVGLGWPLANDLGTGRPSRWAKKRAAGELKSQKKSPVQHRA